MTTSTTAADLRAAADLLRRDGWRQGSYEDTRGCHCAAGAVLAATGIRWNLDDNDYTRASRAFESILRVIPEWKGPYSEGAIIVWNDKPGRTANEVIATIEAAAAMAAMVETQS